MVRLLRLRILGRKVDIGSAFLAVPSVVFLDKIQISSTCRAKRFIHFVHHTYYGSITIIRYTHIRHIFGKH